MSPHKTVPPLLLLPFLSSLGMEGTTPAHKGEGKSSRRVFRTRWSNRFTCTQKKFLSALQEDYAILEIGRNTQLLIEYCWALPSTPLEVGTRARVLNPMSNAWLASFPPFLPLFPRGLERGKGGRKAINAQFIFHARAASVMSCLTSSERYSPII